MSRPDRLLELVHLLGGRRSRSLREIVDHFQVSERTAYRDLAALERRNILLARDERGYRLIEGSTLRPLDLTTAERALLRLALDNPALSRPSALARRLRTLRAKLDAVSRPRDDLPQPFELAGPERSGSGAQAVVEQLEPAISHRLRTGILYVSISSRDRRWRTVDPYALVHREGAWYLVAHCHEHAEPRLFRLDRIEEVRSSGARFEAPESFDLSRWLAGAWSVFRGGREVEVVLRVAAELAPLLRHARHHQGERLEELPGGAVEYRVKLTHLEEIARWVVGFGGRVTVVAPRALRRRVTTIAEGVLGANERSREEDGASLTGSDSEPS